MLDHDAYGRFMQAVSTHQSAEERAKAGNRGAIDVRAFQLVLIDLKAVIPGLRGLDLGRAYGLTASSHYWIFWAEMLKSRVFDVRGAIANPNRKAGLEAAKKARGLLVGAPSEDRKWIESLVERLAD